MPDFSAQSLLASLRATSAAEWIAVATGVFYILLIMRRNRWGWLAGGISSLILAVIAARSHLPMQALLQLFYVAAAVYGWWSWAPQTQPQQVSIWTWRGHALALAACLTVSLGLARLLAGEGYSAFPFIDSLVACAGLFATWLVARVYLENWLYWIVIDVVSLFLFLSQGLVVAASLFAIYLVISVVGLRSWWRIRRDDQRVAAG
ncbi:MAG: nicotinamide riboside transporter PnuC [Steroidobacteraceae bacterium]